MAVTATPRFALPQWGAGSDSPSRVGFNDAFAKLEARAAYDDGATVGTLPAGTIAGRYAWQSQVIGDSTYRTLHRRAADDTWWPVGGPTEPDTKVFRGIAAAAAADATRDAWRVEHGSIGSGSAGRAGGMTYDGLLTARRGLATPGKVAVGTAAEAPAGERMRVTTTGAERALVLRAGDASATGLLRALDSSGAVALDVDATGRLTASKPAAFGTGTPTTNVPLISAAGSADEAAARFYANTSGPRRAVQAFRALGETDPIFDVLPDAIRVGRPTWTGGRIDLTAPTVAVTGALGVTGASTLTGTLGVSGQTTLAGVTAGAVSASSLAATGAVSAHGGLVTTQTSGSGAELRTRPAAQVSGTAQQSVRAPMVARVRDEVGQFVYAGGDLTVATQVVMPEDGWMHMVAEVLVAADYGNGGGFESMRYYVDFALYNSGNSSLVSYPTGTGSDDRVETIATDDTVRQIHGYTDTTWTEIFGTRISAGTYTIRASFNVDSVLGGQIVRIRYTTMAVVLHSSSTT